MIPPSGYSGYLPIIERVFASGVAPYIHATGFDAYRFITGVTGVAAKDIDPLHTPANPARALISGNPRLFTADRRNEALVESLGHTGDGKIPPGTFEIKFYVTGQTLNHNLITDPEYQHLFRMTGKGNEENHRFSQCVDFHLEKCGYSSQYDTYSWLTVAGEQYGYSGFVHSWKSQNPTTITHVETKAYNVGVSPSAA
jgi:hypothetical protein